jgi:hypothetical protein
VDFRSEKSNVEVAEELRICVYLRTYKAPHTGRSLASACAYLLGSLPGLDGIRYTQFTIRVTGHGIRATENAGH